MELRLLFVLFRRWFWLLFLGAAIGGAAGYYYSISQPSVYRSTTKVMVMQPRESLTSDLTDLTDTELAETFRNLLVVKPVIDATSERIGGPVSAGQISSKLIEGTQLLQVTVQDKDPERAALIANTLVDALIEQNDALQSNRFRASEESLQAQIAQVEAQMEALRAEEGQRTELSGEEIAVQKQTLETEILSWSEQIAKLNEEIADLSGTGESSLSLSPVESRLLEEKNTELAIVGSQLTGARSRYEQLLSDGAYEGELELQSTRIIDLVEARNELEKSIFAITGTVQTNADGELDTEALSQVLTPEQLQEFEEMSAELALLDSQLAGARSRYEQLIANGSFEGELETRRTLVVDLIEQKSELEKSIAAITVTGETSQQKEERRALLRDKQAELALLQLNLDFAGQRYQGLVYPQTAARDESGQQSQSGANMALYQQIYSSLLSNFEAVRLARTQGTPNVVQVERASPGGPVRPNEFSTAILWATIGMIITGSIAFLIEYLDDTLKTPEDIERVLDVPVVGFVADTPELSAKYENDEGKVGPFVSINPRAPLGETFRNLRTNLEFADVDDSLKTILVTSAGPGEGKTTVAANLAASFSQQQKNVVLVDCDLRRPKVHKVFEYSNDVGMSDMFLGRTDLENASHMYSENLRVITSGSLPSNPAELLGSDSMTNFLQHVEDISDVVVIDSPPSIVTDAAILSAKVDGVVLVVHPGKTHADDARAQLDQMRRAGARVVGVVLNRIPRRRGGYYSRYGYKYHYYRNYRYDYGSSYGLSENGHSRNGKNGNGKKKRFRLFRTNGKKKASK